MAENIKGSFGWFMGKKRARLWLILTSMKINHKFYLYLFTLILTAVVAFILGREYTILRNKTVIPFFNYNPPRDLLSSIDREPNIMIITKDKQGSSQYTMTTIDRSCNSVHGDIKIKSEEINLEDYVGKAIIPQNFSVYYSEEEAYIQMDKLILDKSFEKFKNSEHKKCIALKNILKTELES